MLRPSLPAGAVALPGAGAGPGPVILCGEDGARPASSPARFSAADFPPLADSVGSTGMRVDVSAAPGPVGCWAGPEVSRGPTFGFSFAELAARPPHDVGLFPLPSPPAPSCATSGGPGRRRHIKRWWWVRKGDKAFQLGFPVAPRDIRRWERSARFLPAAVAPRLVAEGLRMEKERWLQAHDRNKRPRAEILSEGDELARERDLRAQLSARREMPAREGRDPPADRGSRPLRRSASRGRGSSREVSPQFPPPPPGLPPAQSQRRPSGRQQAQGAGSGGA